MVYWLEVHASQLKSCQAMVKALAKNVRYWAYNKKVACKFLVQVLHCRRIGKPIIANRCRSLMVRERYYVTEINEWTLTPTFKGKWPQRFLKKKGKKREEERRQK